MATSRSGHYPRQQGSRRKNSHKQYDNNCQSVPDIIQDNKDQDFGK